jgi:hypothetical protein
MNRLLVGLRVPGVWRLRICWRLAVVAAACLALDVAVAQDRGPVRGPGRSRPAVLPNDRDTAARQAPVSDQNTAKNEQTPLTLRDVIKFSEPSQKAMEDVKDYTAVFTKTELIRGRQSKQVMEMKFRTKPFSVYFKYLTGPEAGRQAIFVDGKFGNRLVVKEAAGLGAIAGRLTFKLDDPKVMAENRYPVTNVGIGNLLNTAVTIWDRESKLEAAEVDVKFFPNAKLGDLPVEAVQLTHLKPLRDVKFHMSRVYFDKESKLPLRAERFGWPRQPGEKPPLVEDYIYTKLKTNVKLTDAHFDPATYGF